MHFMSPMSPSAKQRGNMLIVALFILLVLGALGTGLVSMLRSENRTSAYEVFAVRATEAARTGADAMFAQLFPVNGATQRCVDVGSPQNLNVSTVVGLQGCQVTTSCRDRVVNLETHYLITASASCGGGSGPAQFIVEREIIAEAKAR